MVDLSMLGRPPAEGLGMWNVIYLSIQSNNSLEMRTLTYLVPLSVGFFTSVGWSRSGRLEFHIWWVSWQ